MEEQFKNIASLIGDPTRAAVLWVLLDGKAFTATELSIAADTSPQNMSMHLNKMLQAGLLSAESQGRHRYYRFAAQEVAYAIEALASLVKPVAPKNIEPATRNDPTKYCRTCYDHLAGKAGVMITDGLLKQGLLVPGEKIFDVSSKGIKWFNAIDIDVKALQQLRRPLAKPCLDWSERRYHLAGSLGASLLDSMLAHGWIRRTRQSRAVIITAKGQQEIYKYFRLQL
jgi:DNA-binding transcriptional ArsR family regulator